MDKKYNSFARYHDNPIVLLEGGLYGHMSHIYEDYDLTFNDLKNMIAKLLQGQIRQIKEKVDGQALAVSMNDDGNVIFARNKSHIVNFGEEALTWKGISDQFADRGDLTDAFTFAAQDLAKALCRLDKESQRVYFGSYDDRLPKLNKAGVAIRDKNGEIVKETVKVKKWLNFEIVWPETTNVVPYNHRLIIFHNYDAFDINGKKRDSDFNEFAQEIKNKLEGLNQTIQQKYTISTMPLLTLPRVRNFGDKTKEFEAQIDELMMQTGLSDMNTIGDYYTTIMSDQIFKSAVGLGYQPSNEIVNIITRRWMFDEKSPAKGVINKMIKNDKANLDRSDAFLSWFKSNDQVHMKRSLKQSVVEPIKQIVVDLGVEVMQDMTDILALNPTKATITMRDSIAKTIKQIEATGDIDQSKQIEKHLTSLARAGGLDKVVPSEGLTFSYKRDDSKHHVVYKLTGNFADINQIIGFFKYGRGKTIQASTTSAVDKNQLLKNIN